MALYKALGTIQSLRYLSLTYNIFPAGLGERSREGMVSLTEEINFDLHELPSDPSFDEFDNQFCEEEIDQAFPLRRGDVRKFMTDTIVDMDLSCAIFQTISSAKALESPLLQEITIGFRTPPWNSSIERLMRLFTNEWRIRRDIRSTHRDKLIAEPKYEKHEKDDDHLAEWLEPIFHRMFPSAKPKGRQRKMTKKLAAKRQKEKYQIPPTWRRHMHSFLLASDIDN